MSLKIKISMTLYVERVYMKLKKKVQEQWLQLKKKFLLGTNMKNCYLVGKLAFGGGVFLIEFFQVEG